MLASPAVRRIVFPLLAALSCLFFSIPAAYSAAKVTVHLELDQPEVAPGSETDLIVWAEVERGWHINANKPTEEFLVPTEATLTLPSGLSAYPINYPRPDRHTFAFAEGKELLVYEGKIGMTTALIVGPEVAPGTATVQARIRYQACNDSTCAPPAVATAELVVPIRASAAVVHGASSISERGAPQIDAWLSQRSFPVVLLLVMLLGLGLNLTPCVYPLISVTIAFFGSQGHHRIQRVAGLATLYVLGITLSFATVGVLAASSGGIFGALLQKPVVLLGISGLMVVLALSSFGAYQLQPPAWLLQRAGASAHGALGALFMGLTMGIVAAPCVGPVVLGLLLFVGSRQDIVLGFALFFALGLGMGIPYLALALVAGSIKTLPRSGDWLLWVEHFFGFMLLGMAVYFVSPLLPAQVRSYAMPLLLAIAGVFLGFLDRAGANLPLFGWSKKLVGAAALATAVWMAMPPPVESSIRWQAFEPNLVDSARAARRPVLIDFVADWCIPCHEMDKLTYTDGTVRQEAERFVMLKVDITSESDAVSNLADKYGVKGVPTVILYDGDGTERSRMVGFTGAEEMAAAMRQVQ